MHDYLEEYPKGNACDNALDWLAQAYYFDYNKSKEINQRILKSYRATRFGRRAQVRLNLIEEKERPGLYADHVLKEKTRRFYLIVASFEHRKNAGDFILRLKKKGFYDAKIIVENDKFRISLKDFAALRDAKAMRINTVLSEFEDAWILQY